MVEDTRSACGDDGGGSPFRGSEVSCDDVYREAGHPLGGACGRIVLMQSDNGGYGLVIAACASVSQNVSLVSSREACSHGPGGLEACAPWLTCRRSHGALGHHIVFRSPSLRGLKSRLEM